MSSLGNQRIRKLELHVPARGRWRALVTLADGAVPSGKVTITIADATFVGTVVPTQAGLDAPDSPGVAVVGGLGWDTSLGTPPPTYAGVDVRLRTVLADLSTRAGEPIVAPSDASMGPVYALAAGTCKDALDVLVRRGIVPQWWIDPATGNVRFDARPSGDSTAKCTFMRRAFMFPGSPRELGLDGSTVMAFLPGMSVEGATIQRVIFREEAHAITAEVRTV